MGKKLLLVSIISLFSISTLWGNEALLKEATAGNAEAQFKVAAMYATGKLGNKTAEDRKKMFEWLEKSAEQNYLKAQETLCKQYLERCNFSGALKWAKKAMKQKSNIGKATMAYLLYYGENVVPIDKTRAYTLINECPTEPLAKILLGFFYTEGWFDFEINFDKAIELAKEAAKGSSSKAYALLAYVYLKQYFMDQDKNTLKKMEEAVDEGLKKNPFDIDLKMEKALILLLFSDSDESRNKGTEIVNECIESDIKEANLILSQYELLFKKNNKKALEYIEKADNYYCSEDCYNLFELFVMGENREGLKTEKNPKKAREIALKAISFNNQKFLEKYIPCYKLANLNPEYKKFIGEAYIEDFDCDKYVKIAADNGSPAMMFLYSKMLQKGLLSSEESLKYKKASANMGWAEAQAELGAEYFIKKDYEKAYYWSKKAHEQHNCSGTTFLGQIMFLGVGNCPKDEEKGLNLILSSIIEGCHLKAVSIAFRKYTDEKKDNYNIYFLGQIYLKSVSPEDINIINAVKTEISKAKESLSQEEIEKADKYAQRVIEMNQKSMRSVAQKNLINYGVINF